MPAGETLSLNSWEDPLPRHSASCKRTLLRAIEYLAARVLKNLQQGCRSRTASNADAVIDVVSVVASSLLRRLANTPGSVLSSKFDWQADHTQMTFKVSTCVARSRDKLGVSVRIVEPSANLRLDEPRLRFLCDTVERTLLRTIAPHRAMSHGAPARRAGGFRFEPLGIAEPGFEVHRNFRHRRLSRPAQPHREPDRLQFVKGRLSAKLTAQGYPQAVIVLLFTTTTGV